MHISIDKANLNTINVSTPDFHIWQHFGSNWTTAHMQKLVDIPEVAFTQFYKHIIGQSEPILPCEINRDMKEGSSLTSKLLTHPGTYIVCIGIYCLRRFGADCHTEVLTLLPSLIAICYCGWWCRGRTHLQEQKHSWNTCKTPCQSWPVHRTGGYEAGESLQATSFVKRSSFSQIIGC